MKRAAGFLLAIAAAFAFVPIVEARPDPPEPSECMKKCTKGGGSPCCACWCGEGKCPDRCKLKPD